MIGNRVSTAQLADDMLNEFYVKSNLDKARAKHNKRVEKRLIQQGMMHLSPLQQQQGGGGGGMINHSQSLDGPAWHRHGKGTKIGAGSGRPNSKTVSFGGNTRHDYDSQDDDISMSSLNSSSSKNMLSKHAPANPLGHHAVTDMMHRVTYQSGRPAGEASPLNSPEKPSSTTEAANEEELDNVTKAANAKEVQYQGMLNSEHMQQIMRYVPLPSPSHLYLLYLLCLLIS